MWRDILRIFLISREWIKRSSFLATIEYRLWDRLIYWIHFVPCNQSQQDIEGKRLLFISSLKANAFSGEHQFFFSYIYIGAIFIFHPLYILTFYLCPSRKLQKYVLFQILRKMVNISPLKGSQALHPVSSSQQWRASRLISFWEITAMAFNSDF